MRLVAIETASELREAYVSGKVLPRLRNGEPPKFLFRVMSSAEYEAGSRGAFKPRPGERIHASLHPDFSYCEPGDSNVLVRITYSDADGWTAKQTTSMGVVAVTYDPIPKHRVELIAQGDRTEVESAFRRLR